MWSAQELDDPILCVRKQGLKAQLIFHAHKASKNTKTGPKPDLSTHLFQFTSLKVAPKAWNGLVKINVVSVLFSAWLVIYIVHTDLQRKKKASLFIVTDLILSKGSSPKEI